MVQVKVQVQGRGPLHPNPTPTPTTGTSYETYYVADDPRLQETWATCMSGVSGVPVPVSGYGYGHGGQIRPGGGLGGR